MDSLSGSQALLAACVRRMGRWRVPPNWSRNDWLQQVRSLAESTAWEATSRYDPARGVPLNAFLYVSMLAAVRTVYRQEWAYAERFESQGDQPPDGEPRGSGCISVEIHESLREALANLSNEDHWVISQLFWNGATEAEVARGLGVSQPAMSKRKARIIEALRWPLMLKKKI
jgi:DNA-directed RNA polymerase specialized sigma24 family protein